MQDAVWTFRDMLRELNIDARVSSMVGGLYPDEGSLFYIPLLNIGRAMDDIEASRKQIRAALDVLNSMLNETDADCDRIRMQMDRLTLKAQL